MLTNLSQSHGQLVGQRDRGRHQLLGLVTGVPEHHALVAGAPCVHAERNITRLFVNAGNYGAGVGIKSIKRAVVADRGNDSPHQGLEINVGLGGDFAGDHDQTGGGQGLTGHATHGVIGQAGVEDAIRNLIGDFIGVAFGDRFRGKKITVLR